MYYLNVPQFFGEYDKLQKPIYHYTKEVVYNVNDFPYEKFIDLPTCKTKKKIEYLNVSSAFDIETTTIKCEKPFGFMYQWQFCLKDTVVFGRTWQEFLLLIKFLREKLNLSENRILVIYVHNLAYEFQFMKDFLQINSMFAKDKRKPMKLSIYGIEFRCSYFLSNMSLGKLCENSELCTYYKLSDTYDYKKLRTYKTELTELEKGYCYNDVRGLCQCIDTYLQDDNIATIPLTSTGFVRREYRKAMNTPKNRELFLYTSLDAHLYDLCKRAFRGGNTHANRKYANKILSNVYSCDLQSSYPSWINLLDEYPMRKFTKVTIKKLEEYYKYNKDYCMILVVEYYNITCNFNVAMPYIDIAHCEERSNIINDNGRVLSADFVKIPMTNIDFDIINETYTFEDCAILECYISKKGKLPKELRSKMMDFYKAKTQLKGIDDKVYEYMKSKNKLNATFGMCVTAIDHSTITYDADTMLWDSIVPDLQKALDTFYNGRNNFLAYQWGVFITANARRKLQNMLNVVGMDAIYCDTDSIKFINEKHLKEFEEVNKQVKLLDENNDIPAYCDRDNERYYLGIWEYEGMYQRFKTLGAKKYCFEKINKKGKLEFEVTVSGMNKKKGAKAVGNIENFIIGKTYKDVGRTVSYYNDEKPHKITIGDDTFLTASNIGIVDTTYTVGVTNEYWNLIFENNG